MYSVAVSTRLRTVSSRSSAISSALFSSCVRREISAAGRRDALNTAMTRHSSPALTTSSTNVMPSSVCPFSSFSGSSRSLMLWLRLKYWLTQYTGVMLPPSPS